MSEAKYKTTEYKVEKDNLFAWLYDMVEKNAKDLGLDIEKEAIKVAFLVDSDDPNLRYSKNDIAMKFDTKTLYVGIGFRTKLSEAVKNPDNVDSALQGFIRHELQHYKDFKGGYYDLLMLPGMGEPIAQFLYSDEIRKLRRVGECRADSVSAGNDEFIEFHKNNNFFYNSDIIYTPSTHPSGSDRMRSLMIQSYIKEHTKSEANPNGIELTPDYVEFNERCQFSIINKDKLHAIPAEVLIEGYNKAERNVPKHIHHSLPEEVGRVFSVPSVPLKPKAKQNWDARKGMEP